MKGLLVVGVCLAGLAVSGVASRAASEPTTRPVTTCLGPRFQGVSYRPRELRTTWLRVGPLIGTIEDYGPYGRKCIRSTRAVYRLRGIAPAVALSLGGSSRRLIIRWGVCDEPVRRSDAWLVRCLRGGTG